jgi:hypothetical protein
MPATEDSNAFVETPTDYGTNTLDCDQTIKLYIGGVSNDTATYICQQLSLFIETHDAEAFKRTVSALQSAVDDFEEFAIEVGPPSEIPADCSWPIELEVEGVCFDAAHQIVGGLMTLLRSRRRSPGSDRTHGDSGRASGRWPRDPTTRPTPRPRKVSPYRAFDASRITQWNRSHINQQY